jgi:carbonic anhydrase/acetyltransferase-like protein (isoleucine patch superfamily)
MAIYEFEGKQPKIAGSAFVPESADIIGDVTVGEGCFVGVGARLRGDYGTIVIGERTSVQENVVIHARVDDRTVVGSNVQLGHGCILHNCTVRDNAVIGVGAIITDFVTVGAWAIVGEGAVVRADVPDERIAVGVPARVVGEVSEAQKQEWLFYKELYVQLAACRYPRGLKRIG